jgi:peroxiredoxin
MCALRPFIGLFVAVILAAPGTAAEPAKIGDRIPDLTFKDIRYLARSLDDFPGRNAYVLAFVTTGCPVVPRYLPALKRLDADYGDKGVQILAVNVGPQDSIVETARQAVEHGAAFPFVKDLGGKWATALGITHTPQVAVLDAERRLRYRGRIDDQYRPGVARPEPSRHDLKGTRLECVALYDNSAFNPHNPDPKATVRDGPQTYHEMMNGFFFYLDANEDLKLEMDGKTGHAKKSDQ